MTLQVAQIVEDTEAEGPGIRFAVWLQGCPLRCPGCCNPEMLPVEGGVAMAVAELWERIRESRAEGLTLLGGEPFFQAAGAAQLSREVRAMGKSVMVFTGYRLEELSALRDPAVDDLLANCDLLVDGRYQREQPDEQRRWVGSKNQRVHFLTDRYRADDPQFSSGNTVELRLQRGELIVNGWPALAQLVRNRRAVS